MGLWLISMRFTYTHIYIHIIVHTNIHIHSHRKRKGRLIYIVYITFNFSLPCNIFLTVSHMVIGREGEEEREGGTSVHTFIKHVQIRIEKRIRERKYVYISYLITHFVAGLWKVLLVWWMPLWMKEMYENTMKTS